MNGLLGGNDGILARKLSPIQILACTPSILQNRCTVRLYQTGLPYRITIPYSSSVLAGYVVLLQFDTLLYCAGFHMSSRTGLHRRLCFLSSAFCCGFDMIFSSYYITESIAVTL